MRVIYIRTAKGLPSEADQMATITEASGATEEERADAWVDRAGRKAQVRTSERDLMLGAVRDGDEVWVARPGIIGASDADILAWLARMTEHGGVLCIASTGRRYRWHPDTADALRLVAEIKADERSAVLAKARAAIKRRPGAPVHGDNRLEVAKQLWADPRVTAKEAAARSGIGVRHLYRLFGRKGTAPFTGGPRKRGRA